MVEQHFCLRWNNYRTNITAEFETLREGEHFVDVTLACDGLQLKAHKVVLSACSPYFKELLQANPCSHPIIILRDVAYTHMRSLLEFMYAGEVNISQAQLGSFLHTAEALKIRGLAESSENRKSNLLHAPFTSLKNTLDNYRGISMAMGSDPIAEQPINPFLLQCNEKATSQLSRPHSPPLPHSTSYASFPRVSPQSEVGRHPLCSTAPSEEARSHSPQPAKLNAQTGQQGLVVKGEVIESNESIPTASLPPNKRHCSDPKYSARSHKTVSDTSSNMPHNGCTHLPQTSMSLDSAPTDLRNPSTFDSNTVTEEPLDKVPKLEPCDPTLSDPEASGGGWLEESDNGGGDGGDEGGGGRESVGSGGGCSALSGGGTGCSVGFSVSHLSPPCPPTPDKRNPTNSSDAENTSHLPHGISSESHLHGASQTEGENPVFSFEGNQDSQIEFRRMRPEPSSSSPPLPPSSLPHSCQLCGKMISCRRNLWKHMERVHLTNPAVQCSLCTKMFKNKYALKDHQRIYHGGLSQLPQARIHHSPSSSLLSRILQDSHHANPTEAHSSHEAVLPHLSSPPIAGPPTHPHYFPSQRLLPEDDSSSSIAGGSSMAALETHPQILPHSTMSSMPPSFRTSSTAGRPSNSEWNSQEDYTFSNHSFLGDIHRMVTKAD